MTNLLERDDLLDRMQGRVDAAREGEGAMVLIAGEAGAGKTSLVREAGNRAAKSAVVVEGACDPLSTPRPLSPLMDFAADREAGMEALAERELEQMEMFEVVLDALRGRLRPMFMVVEDIHWADEGTLDFLRFIGRRVADSNGVIACTYRDDEVGPDHPLRPVLGQLAPMDSTHRLQVPPLSVEAVITLSAGHDIDPVRLHELTGGNAFYVTEVIGADQEVPSGVQDAVLARVARLGSESRRAIDAVSIDPRSMEIEYLSPLSGASPSQLDRTVAAGVLHTDGHAFRFRHELARAAIEASISKARRIDLHLKMVSLLAEENPIDLARIAHHAIRAESDELIARYVPEAAGEASSRGSHRESAEFYAAAVDALDVLPSDRQAEMRCDYAAELRLLGRPSEALEQLLLAREYYEQAGDNQRLGEVLGWLAGARWDLSETEEARRLTYEAIELLEPGGPSEALARLYQGGASFWMLARKLHPGIEMGERALEIAEEIGSEELIAAARQGLAWLEMMTGDVDRGLAVSIELIEKRKAEGSALASFFGRWGTVPHLLSNLGSGMGEVRRYATALEALEEGIPLGLESDEDSSVAYMRAWESRIAFEQGRWGDAVEWAELVEATAPNRIGITILTARGALGRMKVRRGDEGGRQLLEENLTTGVRHEFQHVWPSWCGIAEHAWLWGKSESIPEILGHVYERALDTDSSWARGEVGFWMWMSGAIDGPPDRAAAPFALQMSGDWQGAAQAWREIGCPYEVALALSEGGVEEQFEALSIFDSLGARPSGSVLRNRMKDAGIENIPRGPIRETQENPANLTPRQFEVLKLMVEGLSNANIADQLFVSKKTIEHHVSAIFDKLEVGTRAEAVTVAREMI